MTDPRHEALMAEYGEVNDNFRTLSNIRFQLLAFLPTIAAIAAWMKHDEVSAETGIFSLFGLVVTLAVASYNARNDQLYDELVGRAAAIERLAGIPDGAFANRPRPWLSYSLFGKERWTIEHRDAVAAIYVATSALWLTGAIAPLLTWDGGIQKEYVVGSAAALSVIVVVSIFRWLRNQAKSVSKIQRVAARQAVRLAREKSMARVAADPTFLHLCHRLGGTKNLEVVARRARFYASLTPVDLKRYVLEGDPDLVAAQVVGLLTDLPSRWLFDCVTNRRGLLDDLKR